MLRQNFDDGVYPCHKCPRQRKCTTIKSMEKCRAFVEYRAKYGEPPIDIMVSPCDSCEKVRCTRFKECAVYLRWYRAKMEDLRVHLAAHKAPIPVPIDPDTDPYKAHLRWMVEHCTWREDIHNEREEKAGA